MVFRTPAAVVVKHVQTRHFRGRIRALSLRRSASTHSAKNGEHPSGASHFFVGVANLATADALCRTRATVAGEHVEVRRYCGRIGPVSLRWSASTRSAKDDEHRVANPAPADAVCRTRAVVAGGHVERRRYRARIGAPWLHRSASTHSAKNGEHPSSGSHLAVGVPNSAPADVVAELVRLEPANASRDAAFVRGSYCDLGYPRSTSKKEGRKKFFFCVCRGAPIIAAISTQTAVGRSPRLTWFFELLRRSPSSTSKYATFVVAFALFRFAGVPALTLPKTANIRAAVPTFASAS
ncbi:hypothetical protein MRX96_058761 [Rhipicephalus microplus]